MAKNVSEGYGLSSRTGKIVRKQGEAFVVFQKEVHWAYVQYLLRLALTLAVCCAPLCLRANGPVEIVVEGIKNSELENVKTALTLPAGLVENGTVNKRWLEYFVRQIPAKTGEALKPYGFYKPFITVSSVFKDDGIHRILVLVDPGEPVKVTSVDVKINGPGKNEQTLVELVLSFPLSNGAVLRQDIYEDAKKEIRARAIGLGYIDADFTTHTIRVTPEEKAGEINLVLDTGPLYYFGDVHYSGVPEYPESFFGRYTEFKAGDVFSYEKIGLTHRNLINADRFEEVAIQPDRDRTDNYRIPVDIVLKPSKPKRLKFGVGYETDIGPKGSVRYEDVNLFRTSHKFESRIDISESLQTIGAGYTIPDKKDTKSFSSLSFNVKREDEAASFTESVTAEFERARTLGKTTAGSLFVQMMKERSDAGNEKTNSFLLLPGCRLSGVYYDNMVRPTRGYRFTTELKGTHQFLGSDIGLVQMTAEGGLVLPLPARFTIHTRAKIGATVQNESRSDLPIALRFFAGGDRSVRGYSYKSLGPEDADGDVVGGKHILVASIEIERALGKDWGVAAFYDAGNAFNDFSNMQLAQGAGIGVRYYTPVGPIKLDIARQIGVKKPDFRLHISIGLGI